MAVLIALLTLALVAFVVLLVSAPLRRGRATTDARSLRDGEGAAESGARALERDELEAAREAKYREIRDCELDFRTGKLSPADYETVDAQLRGEALAILDRLQALDGTAGEGAGAG